MAPASFTDTEHDTMREALALAQQAFGLTEPNPRVGCVLAGNGWRASGHTQPAGQAHAEVMALRDARARGHDPRGATAFVTLEPCAHHGRTPPCCDALIEAGLARVVVATLDPFPQVNGEGVARLRAAGIRVDTGLLADEARDLNIGFFSRVKRDRPWLRMKIAASLDGRTALANGRSQWITGEPARADGHAWRRRAGAVLTGVGTLLEDNPRLDVRLVPTTRQPLRVLVDSRLDAPADARLFAPPGDVLVYAAALVSSAGAERLAALRERGIEVVRKPGPGDKVDLAAMLADLAARGVNELHVEAGHKLNGSLLRDGLVDELLVYLAPRLIGLGREMAAFGPLTDLAEAMAFEFIDVQRVGADIRLRARPPHRAEF